MELFSRRYLSLFCFTFLTVSLIGAFVTKTVEMPLVFVLSFLLAVGICVTSLNKKHRLGTLIFSVCMLSALVAAFCTLLFVKMPSERAEAYAGRTETVEAKIISKTYGGDGYSGYKVRLVKIGEKKTDITASLSFERSSELYFGDRLAAVADIEKNGKVDDSGILLNAQVTEDSEIYFGRPKKTNYFSFDGIRVLSQRLRKNFSEYIDSLFEGDGSGLVKGVLINDKSGLSASEISDFKRSGLSHMLAVSGLHISLLLGAFELLLRKLYITKRPRCAVVACLALILLALTDFSASAVRSVLMLFAVYASYLFSEDNDTVTSLFLAVTLITVISPYSVYDLGMWMSFFATLGLVSVFPYFEAKLPHINVRKRVKGRKGMRKLRRLVGALSLKFLIGMAKTVLLTLTANFFLLPIMWYFFGSISLAAVPANLLVSPLMVVYLPLCGLTVILGRLPYLSKALVLASRGVGEVISETVKLFSGIRGSVVSLRYPLVSVLVIIFALSLFIMLVVRLRHKMLICIPPAAFSLALAVVISVFSFTAKADVTYAARRNNEFLIFEKAGQITVCDFANGYEHILMCDNIPPYSTEIENYIITHPHKGHMGYVRNLPGLYHVRRLFLPLTPNREELEIVRDICRELADSNTEIVLYNSGDEIVIFGDNTLRSCFEYGKDGKPSVYITVEDRYGNRLLTYTDSTRSEQVFSLCENSRYCLFGSHGGVTKTNEAEILQTGGIVLYGTEDQMERSRIIANRSAVIPSENGKRVITLPLE